jgi:DNA-binding response OmpR family regulator
MTSSRRVLLLSSELPDVNICRALEKRGFELRWSSDFRISWQALVEADFSLIVMDLGTGEQLLTGSDSLTDAIGLINRLRESEALKATPVLVLGEWGTGLPSLALANGADAYERTPIQADRLATSISRLLAEPRMIGAVAGASE